MPGAELPGIILEGVGAATMGQARDRALAQRNHVSNWMKIRKRRSPNAAQGVAKPTPSGGFSVAFEKIGLNEKRAKYDRDNRTIYINLEHPRVAVEVSNSKSRSPHWRYLWLCWWSWLDVPPAALALKSVELRRPSA